jgi:hypothetical protein
MIWKAIVVWSGTCVWLAMLLFALLAVMTNFHQLTHELGYLPVLGASFFAAILSFLLIVWLCRSYGGRRTLLVF